MSRLDDLLARSEMPGRFEKRRRFSLSRDKAIEKLREFSLRDPRQYVLELIQAAVYAGASYIAVDVDDEKLLLAWVGGRPLRESEIAGIFDFLFADRGRREQRHLVQLAVGLNALLQRKPRVLRLESGDGTLDGTTRMDLDRKGRGVLGKPSDPLAGTYLLAEFGADWLRRFRGDQLTREAALVEVRCRYTPVPILLNGSAPFGWKASRQIRALADQAHTAFDDGERRGLVAVPTSSRSRGFSLVVAGVEVTRTPIPELGRLPPPRNAAEPILLSGVICDDDLRKTADQSDIVRDGRFAAMLHAVQPHATRLLQEVIGPGYQPPPLPRATAQTPAGADIPPAAPLPDPIPQLAPRPAMSIAGLQSLPPGSPVFRVRREDAAAVEVAADPARFPHPVLVVRDDQAASLDAAAPDLAVHRLTAPADVDFVRRALERRTRTRSVRVEVELGQDRQGVLELTLTMRGPAPTWADPNHGALPIRIAAGDRTLWCGHMDASLPGVHVALDCSLTEDDSPELVAASAAAHARAEAWRLLALKPDDPEDGRRVNALARRIVGDHLQPHFVADGSEVRLAPALPASWADVSSQLLDHALIPTTDGARSIREFAAIQGTETVWTLRPDAPEASLRVFESRLGYGRLAYPGRSPVLLSVVCLPHAWEWWSNRDWAFPGVRAVLALARTVRAVEVPDGWTLGPAPLPGTILLLRGPVPPGLADATGLLVRKLRHLHDTAGWAGLLGDMDGERCRALARRTLLHADEAAGRLDEAPMLPRSDGSGFVSPRSLREHPAGAVAPLHGPRIAGPGTALVTFDELRALGDLAPELRLDDAPAVWQSLARHTPEGWLLRQPVLLPGLEGWLGLRMPFDSTTGILVQGPDAMARVASLDHRVPCHGLLLIRGDQREASEQQLELLRLARQQLYQELARTIMAGMEPARAAVAQEYATRFVRAAAADAGGPPSGMAGELSRQLTVHWEDGREFGTLAAWLTTAPDRRPRLPPLPGAPACTEAPTADLTARMGRRLCSALGWEPGALQLEVQAGGVGALLRVATRRSGPGRVTLLMDPDHALFARASEDDTAAEEALLLTGALAVARWASANGVDCNLLDVHQVLVAQRVAGADVA